MIRPLLLASASEIRLQLLQNAGLLVTAQPARVDEETIRAALEAEQAKPRDIADALAEVKAHCPTAAPGDAEMPLPRSRAPWFSAKRGCSAMSSSPPSPAARTAGTPWTGSGSTPVRAIPLYSRLEPS